MSIDDMTGGGRLAYMAYLIWLSRNSLTFETKVMPVYQVLERAYSLVKEYSHFDYVDIAGLLAVALSSWNSLATPATTSRVLFIS